MSNVLDDLLENCNIRINLDGGAYSRDPKGVDITLYTARLIVEIIGVVNDMPLIEKSIKNEIAEAIMRHFLGEPDVSE